MRSIRKGLKTTITAATAIAAVTASTVLLATPAGAASHSAEAAAAPVSIPAPPSSSRRPPTASKKFGWKLLAGGGSDEFNYGSPTSPAIPDQTKWSLAGGGVGLCWPGNGGNGRRCDANTRVYGGVLRMKGLANGDTGWLASRTHRQYGRWEAQVRSFNTGTSTGNFYHPVLLIWPDSGLWPQDGEYDYLENGAPGVTCARAFMHYPHDPSVPIQQQEAVEQNCGTGLWEWHNLAFEWTPDRVAGFIDGVQWFSFSGGANEVRECIQCMPSGHQSIQLDNFNGSNMTEAYFEVDWYREYTI